MSAPIAWFTNGVEVEAQARQQVENVAQLPIVGPHIAIMPDVHWGIGATVGSVIPTVGAIIPAAVGVDIGCGMIATQITVDANDLHLPALRAEIEAAIPVGGPGVKGSWGEPRFHAKYHGPPKPIQDCWGEILQDGYRTLVSKHAKLAGVNVEQLGTLGTGNHFIEVCVEEGTTQVWLMLHSGSRGPGNRIGTYFITRAREKALRADRHLPDLDLAWLDDTDPDFMDYVQALGWAQRYALENRLQMMGNLTSVVQQHVGQPVKVGAVLVNCHHNYVAAEEHFGARLYVTRKGAVSAKAGELGIIPGSMGARSYIVRGKGNPASFMSCSHGAGRRMSRGAARRAITVAEHAAATAGVECRKDAEMLDESPAAYKDIDAVMAAQKDLVEVVHTLKQIVCVKG